MISSEKNKDLWIEDYIKRVKVLSAQEIKLLETSWSSENNKVENYFRTDDGQGKLNLWLIDTYNYENLTVEMQVNLNVISKDAGCEIIIKPQKFILFKNGDIFYIVLMIIFGVISQSVIVFAFGAVQVMILYVQNRIIYKNTRNRIIDKIQNM